ncbi:MAG: hypothetical protein K0Q77_3217 [Anaerosporomusa subterranea]|nr:hypothetical protein [Anaerosporomusa subterranea]
MLEVTAAIILKADSVFIAKKGAEGRFAGLWEFPGGKIDPGETAEDLKDNSAFTHSFAAG